MAIKVLLIDSDIGFIVNIKQALESTGDFNVTVSGNGVAAAEALRSIEYDVAVVDFGLPDMDVMQLIMQLRNIQSALLVVMMPQTPVHHERIQFMDVQGSIAKPFSARELMAYLTDVVNREQQRGGALSVQDEFVPPQMPPMVQELIQPNTAPGHVGPSPTELLDRVERDKLAQNSPEEILAEFEEMERHQTGELAPYEPGDAGTRMFAQDEPPPATTALLDWGQHDDEAEAPGTRLLELEEEPPDTTALLEWATPSETAQLHETRSLERDDDEPPETAYLEWENAPETRKLGNTETFEDLIEEHGWGIRKKLDTRRLEPRIDEPPRQSGDTPSVPAHDLEGVRQFLATEPNDSHDFGEVLDAVAQSEPDQPRSLDRFDSLVDSMREPEQAGLSRNRLEDLLHSIASDAQLDDMGEGDPADSTLDYVLDAIRRGRSLSPQIDEPPIDEDDTTIREAIDGIFDPTFEGVLAALAGEEVDEAAFDEPTYVERKSAASLAPRPDDQISPEEMAVGEGQPAWLAEYEAEGVEPPESLPEQEAVDANRLAFDEPPVSDEDSASYPATAALNAVSGDSDDGTFSLNALLSQIEMQLPPVQTQRPRLKPLPSWGDELKQNPQLAAVFGLTPTDSPLPETQVESEQLAAMFDHIEGVAPEPVEEGLPAEFDEHYENVITDTVEEILTEPPLHAEDTRPSLATDVGMDAIEAPDPEDWLAHAAQEYLDQAADNFSVAEEALETDFDQPDEAFLPVDDVMAMADLPPEAEPVDIEDALRAEVVADLEEPPDEYDLRLEAMTDGEEIADEDAGDFQSRLDDMLPAAETVGVDGDYVIARPENDLEDDELAEMAIMLTQYALESSAQTTMLSRPGRPVAQVGDLPENALNRLFRYVDEAWSQRSASHTNALVRFVSLPDAGEFLLYSILVEEALALSMVFDAGTPLSIIRRQARRLRESMDLVPEEPVPLAAETLPSRPTDLRKPAGLQDVIDEQPVVQAQVDDSPRVSYRCLWLPYDPGQELTGDLAEELYAWIPEAAAANAWHLDDLDVHTDYVLVELRVPQKVSPDQALAQLMGETAQRTKGERPDLLAQGAPLWADGYYVVTPPRELSEREIARFITFQRQAQLG